MDMDKTAIGVMDNGEATQMMAPVSNATQMSVNVQCPVCRTPNPPSETYCIDCGFLLSTAPVGVADMPEAPSVGTLVTTDGLREFPLNPGANTVGRENADVLLAHNTVSRMHATVTVADGRACVEDAGSTNGTIVAGSKIAPGEKTDLTDGCEVIFGSFALKYQAPEAESGEQRAEGGEQRAESEEPDEPTQMIEAHEPAEDKQTDLFDLEPQEAVTNEEPATECEESAPSRSEDIPSTPYSLIPTPSSPAGRLISKDGTLSFDIHAGANSIGRREGDNDIVIPDPYCSGRHADLSYADGAFTLTDIGSTNGTLINGVKLEINAPRDVHAGDEITLGRTVLTITSGEGRP